MTRSQRRAHLVIWLLMAGALAAGLTLALDARPSWPVDEESPASRSDQP